MSAANASASAPSPEEAARAQEPSMEEILASIRRIIADDDALPGARRRTREPAETTAPVIDPSPAAQSDAPTPAHRPYAAPALDRRELPPAESPRQEFRADPQPEIRNPPAPIADIRALRLNRLELEPVSTYDTEETADEEGYGDAPLGAELEAYAQEEATESIGATDSGAQLMSSDAASSIAAQFQTLAATMIINDSGLLHKYAQEMMRPMLKQWLDDNLPVIVERLVRAEIERVARGGRR